MPSTLATFIQRHGFRYPDRSAQFPDEPTYLMRWDVEAGPLWCLAIYCSVSDQWISYRASDWRRLDPFTTRSVPPSERLRNNFLKAFREMGIPIFCCICGTEEGIKMNERGEFFCEKDYLPADRYCTHCSRWARDWNVQTHRCGDCYRQLVVDCCMCGEETDNPCIYNSQYYCPTCYEEHFFTCQCCGETVHEDDVSFDDYNNPYCRVCTVDNLIRPYNANVLTCLGKDYVGKFPKDRILMGVELETEAEGNFFDTVHRLEETVGDFCIFKRDGSLSNEGIEIVSLPATLATHKELWDKFFNRLPRRLVSWAAMNCGMHVHVSRKPLGMLRIGKMIVFLNDKNNRSLITQIAGRYGNDYCVPKHKSITQIEGKDRYEMLNLVPTDTVEFRIFRGTLNREHFYANLEFVDSLVRFCGRESIRRINKECYLDYVHKNKKEYPYLVDFLRKRDLTSTTISDEGER